MAIKSSSHVKTVIRVITKVKRKVIKGKSTEGITKLKTHPSYLRCFGKNVITIKQKKVA